MDFRGTIENTAWDERFLAWADRNGWPLVGYVFLAVVILDLLTRLFV